MAKSKSYMRAYRAKKRGAVSPEAIARLQAGEMPTAIPGTAYPEQLATALDAIAQNYVRPQEITDYMNGIFPDGTLHFQMRYQVGGGVDKVSIRMGDLTTGYFNVPDGLTPSQRSAFIEWRTVGAYNRAKQRNLL